MERYIQLLLNESTPLTVEPKAQARLVSQALDRAKRLMDGSDGTFKPTRQNVISQVELLKEISNRSAKRLMVEATEEEQLTVNSTVPRIPHIKPRIGAPGEMMADNLKYSKVPRSERIEQPK
eukprot:gnl/Chilomastix_caulleri/1653.p1 GENE.gnl/Chilomastix_caulleri/1653~~gnl/Chilomastix_caulleri/1653.p1  ORF type:complete len:122 (+),score=27.37 gnl/Chilomastix_caulleri/1653:2-367(+)